MKPAPLSVPPVGELPKAVSFVVPCLNEEKNIVDTVAEVREAAAKLQDYEIVIVDDGSTDRTGAIADEMSRADSHIRAVHNPRNLGFGGAYKVGIANARMPFAIMVPGDNNHPADGITPILDRLGQADIVIPYVSNPAVRGPTRRLVSGSYTRLLNTLFGLRVPYYNGLVLHRTDLLRSVTIETDGFAYQSEALIKLLRRGATSTSVPVPVAQRGDHSTRAFKLKNMLRVLETIWRLLRTT